MSRTSARSLFALAAVIWLVWCPVAFAVSTLSISPCHGEQHESMDCCQPLVPSSAPAPLAQLPVVTLALAGAVLAAAPSLPPRAEPTRTPLAPPPAGWGRVYASISVYLI